MIGSKATLAPILSEITDIDVGILQTVRASLASIPIATKMSWAATRETTRIEDRAYSLLGIFDIHMPLLYGEEEQAFRRLQEEIIRTTPDLSIFGWCLPARRDPHPDAGTRFLCGILADSPTAFTGCGSFGLLLTHNLAEFSLSNIGVKTRVQLQSTIIPGTQASCYVLPLHYRNASRRPLAVRLRKVGEDQFLREDPWTLLECVEPLSLNLPRESYFFTQLPRMVTSPCPFISMDILMPQMRTGALQIKMPLLMFLHDVWSWGRYDKEDQLFFVSGNANRDCGIIRLIGYAIVPNAANTVFAFETVFCAIGWASTLAEELQCSLVDSRTFANEIKEARIEIADWDAQRSQVLHILKVRKVPKFSVVAFDVPQTDKCVRVSYTLRSIDQPSLCGNTFRAVEFSFEVIERKNLPPVKHEEWLQTQS